ncbi:MAG: aldo/keto reductase, partial [Clostridiaceae bacterium]|nr:aldo/keto reductase [Clostridiaceae bacterium]
QGMLTGKYKDLDHLPDGSRATNDKMNRFIQRYLNAETLDKVRRLGAVADGLGIPLAQMALAWILEEDNVASALIGASRPEQVDQNVKASGYVLPADALKEIDTILG